MSIETECPHCGQRFPNPAAIAAHAADIRNRRNASERITRHA